MMHRPGCRRPQVVPYMGLNFGVYETAKDWVIKFYGEREGAFLMGFVQWLVTH